MSYTQQDTVQDVTTNEAGTFVDEGSWLFPLDRPRPEEPGPAPEEEAFSPQHFTPRWWPGPGAGVK